MQISSQFIEKLRDNIYVSDIVSKRVKLTRKGREYTGLCPFHNEKSPSFTVNDEKQFYHCFGCGAHGDIIKFVMDLKGMNFVEAITSVADEFGFPIPEESKTQTIIKDNIKELHRILEVTTKWFMDQLQHPSNIKVKTYLEKRGISKALIQKFNLGFAPGKKDELKNFLLANKFSEKLMIEAGILSIGENKDLYERFRSRIIFPIWNKFGKVIGFGGRSLGNEMPKYLNSPETILFKKGEILYGEHLAKEQAHKIKRIIVVEGYMDVISMHNAGFTETVACMGTAITENHIKNLWKIAGEPIICLDGDNAGQNAINRAANMVLPIIKAGYSLKFVRLPSSQDPDEVISKQGKDFMENLLDNAIALSTILWENEYNALGASATPEQKSLIEKNLLLTTDGITDKSVKANYKRYFMEQIWENLKRKKNNFDKGKITNNNLLDSLDNEISEIEKGEYLLFALIITYPSLFNDFQIEEEFTLLELHNESLDKLRVITLQIKNSTNLNDIKSENFQIKIESSLEKLEFSYDLKYLYRLSKNFLSIYNGINVPNLLWKCYLQKYHLALLVDEKQKALDLLTQESLEKASHMAYQIVDLEKSINNITEEIMGKEL